MDATVISFPGISGVPGVVVIRCSDNFECIVVRFPDPESRVTGFSILFRAECARLWKCDGRFVGYGYYVGSWEIGVVLGR